MKRQPHGDRADRPEDRLDSGARMHLHDPGPPDPPDDDDPPTPLQTPIEQKYQAPGGPHGLLGPPVASQELTTSYSPGRYRHYAGGSIYWTSVIGAHEVHGAIRNHWAELGWEQGWLGFPVSDDLSLAGGQRATVFEHGLITWTPGSPAAEAGAHHYERLYATTRSAILARFFALGSRGRHNHFAMLNHLAAPIPPTTSPNQQPEAARAGGSSRATAKIRC